MRRLVVLGALLALWTGSAHAARGPVLVELRGESGAFALQAAGGTLVSSELRIWKVPGAAAAGLVPRLRGAVRIVEPDLLLRPRDAVADPLVAQQWWLPVVGAENVTPPGPGVPVTVIDAGVDLTHPEFVSRPNTTALNEQTLLGQDDEHGTAVASVVAAPANGVGVVGVYPQAVLRAFDASPAEDIDEATLIKGVLLASEAGRGVINLSLGAPQESPLLAQAIILAFGRGTIVVAAAGNEFEDGNPPSYPADEPHVLTVGATTEAGEPAPFSSASDATDLAAPGVDIPVAVPYVVDPSGYATLGGTSFAAPQVTGATAWVWTARPTLQTTQVFDLMRLSAQDIWTPGWDKDTGFGLLDIPNALTQAPPPVDPLEPNDEIEQVAAHGIFPTAKHLVKGTFRARMAAVDDPEDVYRVAVPAHDSVTVTLKPDANLNLRLWAPGTQSVTETGSPRLAVSTKLGTQTDVVRWTNAGKRQVVVYADVYFPPRSSEPLVNYALSVKTARARP